VIPPEGAEAGQERRGGGCAMAVGEMDAPGSRNQGSIEKKYSK